MPGGVIAGGSLVHLRMWVPCSICVHSDSQEAHQVYARSHFTLNRNCKLLGHEVRLGSRIVCDNAPPIRGSRLHLSKCWRSALINPYIRGSGCSYAKQTCISIPSATSPENTISSERVQG